MNIYIYIYIYIHIYTYTSLYKELFGSEVLLYKN